MAPIFAAHIFGMTTSSGVNAQPRSVNGQYSMKCHSLPEASLFDPPVPARLSISSVGRGAQIPWELLQDGRAASPRARAVMALYSQLGAGGADVFAIFASIEEIEAAPVWPVQR